MIVQVLSLWYNTLLFNTKKVSMKRVISIVTIVSFALSSVPAFAAESMCVDINQKAQNLVEWLVKEQKIMKPVRALPQVVAYKDVSAETKKIYCNWCPANPNPQLNMLIPKLNQIWLQDDAKEDKLVHELTHFLQSNGDDSEESSGSSELEDQAVYWQSKYKEQFENKKLCDVK
jgi:hypothetical protein